MQGRWGVRVTFHHMLGASAHRGGVGSAGERWGHTVIVAVGVAPRARPRRPKLAPFVSRHMQVANGAAQIKSVCVGGARLEWFSCRVVAARCPQRCAVATASNEETTGLIPHRWWRGGISCRDYIRAQCCLAFV